MMSYGDKRIGGNNAASMNHGQLVSLIETLMGQNEILATKCQDFQQGKLTSSSGPRISRLALREKRKLLLNLICMRKQKKLLLAKIRSLNKWKGFCKSKRRTTSASSLQRKASRKNSLTVQPSDRSRSSITTTTTPTHSTVKIQHVNCNQGRQNINSHDLSSLREVCVRLSNQVEKQKEIIIKLRTTSSSPKKDYLRPKTSQSQGRIDPESLHRAKVTIRNLKKDIQHLTTKLTAAKNGAGASRKKLEDLHKRHEETNAMLSYFKDTKIANEDRIDHLSKDLSTLRQALTDSRNLVKAKNNEIRTLKEAVSSLRTDQNLPLPPPPTTKSQRHKKQQPLLKVQWPQQHKPRLPKPPSPQNISNNMLSIQKAADEEAVVSEIRRSSTVSARNRRGSMAKISEKGNSEPNSEEDEDTVILPNTFKSWATLSHSLHFAANLKGRLAKRKREKWIREEHRTDISTRKIATYLFVMLFVGKLTRLVKKRRLENSPVIVPTISTLADHDKNTSSDPPLSSERVRRSSAGSAVMTKSGAKRVSRGAIYNRVVTRESMKKDFVTDDGKKSASEMEVLAFSLKKVSLMGPISREDRRRAAEMMFAVTAKKGSDIITQGDVGEHLYVIESGTVDVIVDGKKVTTLCGGNSFGEMGLFFSTPRNATIRANTNTVKLWALDRISYRNMLAQSSEKKISDVIKALKGVSLLKSLSSVQLTTLAQAVQVEMFKPGETIISKGETCDKFYVIVTGTCTVLQGEFGYNSTTLGPGTYFGEQGLLSEEKRSATIVTVTNCTCLTLVRKDFNELLGPLSLIMKKRKDVQVLENVELFGSLSKQELAKIADTISKCTYVSDDYIIRMGDLAETFYIIRSGTVKVTRLVAGSENILVTLSAGDYFGEGALLGQNFRTANVVAVSESVACYSLERAELRAIMGPVEHQIYSGIVSRVVRQIPELKTYSDNAIKDAISAFEDATFKSGQVVETAKNDATFLYIICDGTAALSSSETPLRPGDVFGTEMFIAKSVYQNTLTATSAISTRRLRRSYYEGTMKAQAAKENAVAHNSNTTIESKVLPGKDIKLASLEFQKVIGQGGFGRVKLAMCHDTPFAVKVLQKAFIEQENQEANVQNERAQLASFSHPNIASLHQTCQDENCIYFVLDFLPGGELLGVMERSAAGMLPESEAKFYAANVVLVLEYLHSTHSIAYRDLKPENLMLRSDGYLSFIDFGFAKKIDLGERTYTFCGTPEYMSPEVITGKGHDKSVDFWGLGVLIYDMLFGFTPFCDFKHHDYERVCKKVLRGKVKFQTSPSLISNNAEDLILKLLKVDSCKRLGALSGGFSDIKDHPWFEEIDFDDLLSNKITAPWIPSLDSKNDTKYFHDIRTTSEENEVMPYTCHEGSDWAKMF